MIWDDKHAKFIAAMDEITAMENELLRRQIALDKKRCELFENIKPVPAAMPTHNQPVEQHRITMSTVLKQVFAGMNGESLTTSEIVERAIECEPTMSQFKRLSWTATIARAKCRGWIIRDGEGYRKAA